MVETALPPLSVPDRFERLRQIGSGKLQGIIIPIHDALTTVSERFEDMRGADRGSLMLLRGSSGAGKSTFLDTIGLFREGVMTERVVSDADIGSTLRSLGPAQGPRIVVLEGREALNEVTSAELESALHSINAFIRTDDGRDTLVVWPTNRDDLTARLENLGKELGGSSLFSVGGAVVPFVGPAKKDFVRIAERTIGALNQGASLSALGITQGRADELMEKAETIGDYLATIRGELTKNTRRVRSLLETQQERIWVVVIAGNDPDSDVAALTRGNGSLIDIERLMSSTEANVVAELKRHPDLLGILGTVLDARILHVDILTALAVARQYGGDVLHTKMKALGGSVRKDPEAARRILASELGVVAAGGNVGTRKRGMKPKTNTKTAFAVLSQIATRDDGLLNAAIGEAMVKTGLAASFETEVALKQSGVKFFSDLVAQIGDEPIRIEVMWRTETSRAAIANYVLGKLGNYGTAIGLLSTPAVEVD